MSPLNEDSRLAANLASGLSGQLIAASLGMLALLGTFVTFMLDKHRVGWPFILMVLGAAVSFIGSVVVGGRTLAALYKAVNDGSWSPASSKPGFNQQAMATVTGLVLFLISLLLTGPVVAIESSERMSRLSDSLDAANARMRSLEQSIADHGRALDSLRIVQSPALQRERSVSPARPRP